jgi:platelet-activating factor acetylhydrolase
MEQNGNVDHTSEQRKKNYDKVDYIFPQQNPRDTAPNNEKGVDQELRSAQIQLRLAEIEEAHRVMSLICKGDGQQVAQRNLRRKGNKGSSSRGLEGVVWESWENLFHLDKVTVLGHSFGAATATEVLRVRKEGGRFDYVGQGIIYDIWGAAVSSPDEEDHQQISCPLLGINSEAFMYWQSNFDAVTSVVDVVRKQKIPGWLITVRGSVHISQTDFSILYPHICAFLLKMTANPKRALDLNIGASLEFLKHVMKDRSAIIRRSMKDEGILQLSAVDDLPAERRPASKWTAVRLKIPHEFRQRLVPKLERKVKRKNQNSSPETKDEVWVHISTTDEELKGWEDDRANKNPVPGTQEEQIVLRVPKEIAVEQSPNAAERSVE